MNGPQTLEEHVGKLVTSTGAFFPGERVVFRGYDLHAMLKDMDWVGLYLFSISGRHFTPQNISVIQALWSYTSYPDARIWNNRVAALAATARSTGSLGIGAALAISEAKIYGRGVDMRAFEFLKRAKLLLDSGVDLKELVRTELSQKRGIAGYGRPLVAADERIAPVMAIVREKDLDEGDHLKIAFEVENILIDGRWRLRMNYAALTAALCADMSMTPREYYFASMMAFIAGMPPCYIDAVEKAEGSLFPIPCRMIAFEGIPHRCWKK